MMVWEMHTLQIYRKPVPHGQISEACGWDRSPGRQQGETILVHVPSHVAKSLQLF